MMKPGSSVEVTELHVITSLITTTLSQIAIETVLFRT